MYSEHFFWQLGHKFTGHKLNLSYSIGLRRFKNLYGVSPSICCEVWKMLQFPVLQSCTPEHLLWSLCFLKQYHTESTNSAIFGVDEKTYRKYIWLLVEMLGDLDVVRLRMFGYHLVQNIENCLSDKFQIKFDERLINCEPGQLAFVTLDGVDFKIFESKPFNRKFFSHKFKASALRYEIGLALVTGHIVWAYGGYPAGEYPDLKLSRELYVHQVMPGELTFADKGYRDAKFFITPDSTNNAGHKYIMSRHETVNKRFRQFRVLGNTFRHDIDKHTSCFHAVANITALVIKMEDPLFSLTSI